MGFLGRLLGKVAGNAAQRATEKAVDKAVDKAFGGRQPGHQSAPQGGRTDYQSAPQSADGYRDAQDGGMNPPSENLAGDIRGILATDFAQFTVAENIGVTQISAGQDFGGPADFALLSGDGRLAAVIVLVQKGKFRTKRVWGIEKACAAASVPLIPFYYHFPFSREHAAARIARFVKA